MFVVFGVLLVGLGGTSSLSLRSPYRSTSRLTSLQMSSIDTGAPTVLKAEGILQGVGGGTSV